MHFSLGIWDRLSRHTQQRITRTIHPVRLGSLRRTRPVSTRWGKDRGTPVDRYYIDRFLDQYRSDIRGYVLEVGASTYTTRFGSEVSQVDILDNNPSNQKATVAGDLEKPLDISADQYDCLVFTQVLQFVYRFQPAIMELQRILKPGGVLLATLPSASRIEDNYGLDRDYWRFTAPACRRLFAEAFGEDQVNVNVYGNVLSSVAFMEGLAYEELSKDELDTYDPLYPLLVGVRAVKKE